ncbi:MAG: hypothetical protein BZY88_15970 [SAR202 cluster bacterium Io17-Chloro-G9]|nr:MAG: hypothetical protein BZY88_15970 [SAR202 cluster bacterium Io17-Chloro-G9]
MVDLDEQSIYARFDPSGLRHRLRGLPQQCQAGWVQGGSLQAPGPWPPVEVDKVVVCGMGGSAIAGNLISDLIAASPSATLPPPPIIVVRGMVFPFSLDHSSLVIHCSFSGDTGETMSLFHKSMDSSASVMVVAGGGRLAQEAMDNHLPLLRIEAPGEPRSAVGYSLMLLASAFKALGLGEMPNSQVTSAIDSLEQRVAGLAEDIPTQNNLAKQLALDLKDRIIAVYGGGLFSAMARRWKTQLNENAKMWAFYEEIPELLHNAVEAFIPPVGESQGLTALLLKPSVANDPLAPHYATVENALDRGGIPFKALAGEPKKSPLAQLLGMLALGDYVSYYLAMLKEVDPSPTPGIAESKNYLAGQTG